MKYNKKNKPSYAIYNFPYFKREQGFSWIYPFKALLAFVTCWSGTAYINFLMKITEGAGTATFAALTSFAVFYVLLVRFKKRYVWSFVPAAALLLCFLFRKDIPDAAEGFWLQVLKVADGPFVSAYWYETGMADPLPLLIPIYILFGLVCAASSVRRFYPEAIFLFLAVMAVPGFLSLTASYHFSLGVFIAGMIGQWVVNSSSAVNMFFTSGGIYNMHVADRIYKKGVSKMPRRRRLSLDIQRYGRHLSDGFIMFTVTLVTIGIVSSVFPADGTIRFDRIISGAAEFFQKIEGWGNDLFSSFATPSYEGFFSADGGDINISGGLSPDGHRRTGIKIAEVITENTDKIYLRGDVCHSFNGMNWESVSKLGFDSIKYDLNGSNVSVQTIFDKYIPEIQYYIGYNLIKSVKPDHRKYMGLQTVKVNYLRNINTVLFPGTPFIYNFRENDNFTVKGDFVAFANRGKINSMETGVLYPAMDSYECIANSGFYSNPSISDYWFNDLPVTFTEYMNYTAVYVNYVYDYYTEISDEYREIIRPFAEEAINDLSSSGIEEYAKYFQDKLNSGGYRYSLNTDNFSGDNPPLYRFLYETKSGHCAMYATAMCLALRYFGIPARYVTGFTVGGDDYVSHSKGEYKYELTDSDLHAWVEVYFAGLGWLPFDPTPSLSGTVTVDPAHTAGTTAAPTTTPPASDTTSSGTDTTTSALSETTARDTSPTDTDITTAALHGGSGEDNSETVKVILIISAVVLALFIIVMSVIGAIKGLDRKQRNTLKFFKGGRSDKAVKAMLDFMLKLLAMRGIVRAKGETPEKFGIKTDEALGFSGVVSAAIPVFEKSEFDKKPVFTEEEQKTVYGCITAILKNTMENMSAPKRLLARFKLFGRKIKH